MNEQQVIDQLTNYRQIVARIKILEKYSIGNGITVSRLNQDDQLQELHRRLRGMPSYMYLNKREQQLETVAHAYLTKYPHGTRSQLAEMKQARGADSEDEKLLKELRRKIENVIEARAGHVDDFDAVIERISELQDLLREKEQIDNALEALEGYKPDYAKLLRLRYIDGLSVVDTHKKLAVVEKTYFRWRVEAVAEFAKLIDL
ncbi:DUF1492 domain-containing protein [Paenibacillus sp. sptzw28]|uniref:DUF1492 domain-containing protein n=1 Tax=Paenibacillus sp. sptzw28 TaxID=715179 RepID=UPI001C6F280C|nr:DUF1492 domain-containing protein [Paenibacillus sp. sptzw28]QYR20816.1 DUF1492 domain-containing protein [Paenibacillus sp. sptzw28]